MLDLIDNAWTFTVDNWGILFSGIGVVALTSFVSFAYAAIKGTKKENNGSNSLSIEQTNASQTVFKDSIQYIGQAINNGVYVFRNGIDAKGIALISGVFGVVILAAVAITQALKDPVQIDRDIVLAVAEKEGFSSPDSVALLNERLDRAETDLDNLRKVHPDWAAEINAAIEAFNAENFDSAKEAFAEIDALIAARRAELRQEEARSKYTQAILFYPFEYSKSQPLLCDAASLAKTNVSYWIDCGRAQEATGSLEGAITAYQAGLDHAGPNDPNRAVALIHIGGVQRARGDLAAARAAYERALEVARDLAARHPSHSGGARNVSTSLQRIGDVRLAEGDLAGALTAYEKSILDLGDLAARNPANVGWARNAAAGLDRIGEARRAQGDLTTARIAYLKGLAILRHFVVQNPGDAGLLRDMSVALLKMGDVNMAQGDLLAARTSYAGSLDILRDLAARDPGNAGWARDVSVASTRLGDVAAALGDTATALNAFEFALVIIRFLAEQDPNHATWALDLSASLQRIGDVRVAQGELEAALAAYDESLNILRDLASRERGDMGCKYCTSVILEKIGDVRVTKGELEAARAAYQDSLAIRRDLVLQDPSNAEWARGLWLSLWKLASVDTENAEKHWAEVESRMEAMQAAGTLRPADAKFLGIARENLAAARE